MFSALYKCCNVNFVAENTIYVVCLLKECYACMRARTYVKEKGGGGGEEKREENRRGGGEHETQGHGQGMPVHVAVRGQPRLFLTLHLVSEAGSPLFCTPMLAVPTASYCLSIPP